MEVKYIDGWPLLAGFICFIIEPHDTLFADRINLITNHAVSIKQASKIFKRSEMADKITDEQIKEMFFMFDQNGDGCITTKELGTVLRSLGHNPTVVELQNSIREGDVDGSGSLDFHEFFEMIARTRELTKSFKTFDVDQNGFISPAEFHYVMTNLGTNMTNRQMNEYVYAADIDGDGQISFDEYSKVMIAQVAPPSKHRKSRRKGAFKVAGKVACEVAGGFISNLMD
ncbi:Calmodulin-related protein [Zostera marina]|uniref:Calmodulin-related protein n=1 Tax=Zostera marina TaxID=29655 RepID=A0A0K9NY07_ZOSMR|nr:Calmodulin-related protein [Zostera marina]